MAEGIKKAYSAKLQSKHFFLYLQAAYYKESHDMVCVEIILSILRVRLETARKCSCLPRPPSRNEGAGLPGVEANIALEVMENSHTEASDGEEKLLHKR